MAAIRVAQLCRYYGAGTGVVRAVDDVSFSVEPGTLLVVMGASGSGKTTLLRLLGGLDAQTRGSVQVLGQELSTLSASQRSALRLRHVGFVFQDFNLFPELTLQENVAMPLEGAGVDRRTAMAAASQALRRTDLGELCQRYPDEVSGGQQQRAAVARAVVGERAIILADEPTGALDSATGLDLMSTLRRMCDDGVTVVVSTHNVANADQADVVARMADGRLCDWDVQQPSASSPGLSA